MLRAAPGVRPVQLLDRLAPRPPYPTPGPDLEGVVRQALELLLVLALGVVLGLAWAWATQGGVAL